jgi:undecaprenyl diphosphate synthase
VKYFTIWGASEDNLLKRSKLEVDILTRLLKEELKDILKSEEIEREKVRVTIKGKGIDMLKDAELTTLANEVEEKTRSHQNHHFTLLFGYDGKSEMLHAIEEIQKRPSEKVNYESVKKNLMTGELPAVDLVIRTGGEPHWSSGFLMWLTADSELHFTETFWPAFGERQLAHAFQDFAGRRSLKGK